MKLSSLIFTFIVMLMAVAPARAQPTVRLVTIGPGDEVWEKFGHNMIEIADEPAFGEDVSFNWGLFDFDQPNFIGRFVQGRMLYTMEPLPSRLVLQEYRDTNRSILVQELDLSPEQVMRLIRLCAVNSQPQNRDYRYDYFKDNCSTRVRDMIDRATDGELRRRLVGTPTHPPMTYRDHSLRLMREQMWLSIGMDFALGPSCDRELDAWDEAFVPERLAESVSQMVKSTSAPWKSARDPTPTTVPDRRLPMLVAGVLIGGAMGLLARSDRRWASRFGSMLAGLWWVLCGIGSAFMLYVWLFTDHTAGYANQNLLQFSPLAVVVLGAWLLVMLEKRRCVKADESHTLGAETVAGACPKRIDRRRFLLGVLLLVVSVSLLGFILKITTLVAQSNLNFIALALPLNIAAALTVMRSVGLLKR